MKGRLAVSVACVALVFAVSLAGHLYVLRACGALGGSALAAINASPEARAAAAGETLAAYEKHARLLGVFLRHADADSLRRNTLTLSLALETGEDRAVCDALAALWACVGEIVQGERVKWENIL